ncbi:helix-turn-helix domain-containing protein [Spirillospora sp. NPDC048911]|uniref:helix-turn-helix domain-containing protein n=1 Tax=Spirillospora sp. NPDC048911 TaxID=3364527 RepID=UPI003719261C
MAVSPRPTVRRLRLGHELRRLRESSGMKLEAAARRLGRQASALSKIERGVQGLTHGELTFMLDAYAVTDEKLRHALITLRRDAAKKGWWLDYQDRIAPSLLDYISLEDDANAIRSFESQNVPGLLQTPEYARAMIKANPFISSQVVEEQVTIRMARKNILAGDQPPLLWSIVDEAVLHRPFGDTTTLRDQLQYLWEASMNGMVTLQVLPFAAGAHPGNNGAFTLLDIGESGTLPIVLVECLTHSWYLEETEDISRHRLAFEHLCAAALSAADSLELIRRVMSDLG